MAMKETVGSLRTYFLLAGILSGGLHVFHIIAMSKEDTIEPIGIVITVVGLSLACALLYLGVRLKHLLLVSPQQIKVVLVVGAVIIGLTLLLRLLSDVQPIDFIRAIIGWAITWYLYVNSNRLSHEARNPEVKQDDEDT